MSVTLRIAGGTGLCETGVIGPEFITDVTRAVSANPVHSLD